jgi:hypothetical protein
MAASMVSPCVAELLTTELAGIAGPTGTAGTGTGGVARMNRAILPSSVTQMLPSGSVAITPDNGTAISVITPFVVIRPIPDPGRTPRSKGCRSGLLC